MDFSNWQPILALVCVAGAVILLIRRAVRLWTGRSGCGCDSGGCEDCPSSGLESQGVVRKELVSLESSQKSHGIRHENRATGSGDTESSERSASGDQR